MSALHRDDDYPDELSIARPLSVLAADPPPLVRISIGRTARMRLIGGLVAAGCATVLGIAAKLTPDPSGMGTHKQLGLPACSFVFSTGLPCPTCGMTTAYAWMMHGHPVRAVLAQPLGAVLSFATILGAVVGAWMAATGRWIQVDWYRVSPGWLMFALTASFFLAWGAKIGYGLLSGMLPYHP